ncbi:MAG TPA: hypothetical protein VF765_34365, partial [Polyangiaceae bacterium]
GVTAGSVIAGALSGCSKKTTEAAATAGANAEGARALQTHLLAPSTQAQIRSIRYPGDQHVCWVPAGRNNRAALLPKG